ncbi:amidase domain-containing protein [Streptomyces europaeiscabiei]|uniref:Amidase domain-containing protein n=1 Tax=Streptomyces europaeiscabiei TaxID=146819 RepID=A0ABU4N9N6_9ACTN|nr:amidase domain-containing protein [Streptomyces europaeiscabiei]MDX2524011.1 amidase domain-containing protein [Streptomyces europaeiscabiei]MDX2763157.1 amidase domain-containing protein [Streptomyces europaeiscabiei]MDX2772939.1 amidase domain-containing protein [Streptomyces europaeiscabiei]MDX3545285.1 amidase domain-containing protein [Streptomyces europaeiscabiei]MDX3554276.1 amidase domain-containing protein [Streptomyces europaeiscabiei]
MRSRTLSLAGSTLTAAVLATALLPVTAASATASTPKVTSATKDAFGRVADNVLTDRTAVLLGSKAARKSLKPTGGVKLSSGQKKAEDGKLSALRSTKSRLADLGEAYTSADTKVTVDSAKVKGTKATVKVTETTTLKYKKIRGDEPASTGFDAHHVLTFAAQADGTWQLTAMRSTDGGAPRINEPAAPAADAKLSRTPMAIISAPKAATTPNPVARPKTLTGGAYNYNAMATYTEKYWKNYNSAYRKYNSAGGDCTNYLSQGLLAGGWKQISTVTPEEYDTWYYASNGTADAWIGVNEWSWFTQTAKRTTALANVYQMDIGDVLQVDFNKDGDKDHSMMTTYRSSSGVPYLTYHDADTYRRSVASIIASYPGANYYAYRT